MKARSSWEKKRSWFEPSTGNSSDCAAFARKLPEEEEEEEEGEEEEVVVEEEVEER